VRENYSFAPLGLARFPLAPRLTPGLYSLRRFAAVSRPILLHSDFQKRVVTHTLKPGTIPCALRGSKEPLFHRNGALESASAA